MYTDILIFSIWLWECTYVQQLKTRNIKRLFVRPSVRLCLWWSLYKYKLAVLTFRTQQTSSPQYGIWACTSRCAPTHATLDRRPSHCCYILLHNRCTANAMDDDDDNCLSVHLQRSCLLACFLHRCHIILKVTGQFADKPTRGQSSRGTVTRRNVCFKICSI